MNSEAPGSKEAGPATERSRGTSPAALGPRAKLARTRSHWFREGRERTPADLAGVAAFTIWRQSSQCLRNLREAGFGIDTGTRYFDFLAECIVFLAQAADRFAYDTMAEQREAFTSAMIQNLATHFGGNWADLMGDASEVACAYARLVHHYNDRIEAYLFCADDFCAMRLFSDHLIGILGAEDAAWAHAQIMEYEGPALLSQLRSALLGLRDTEPRVRRHPGATTGE